MPIKILLLDKMKSSRKSEATGFAYAFLTSEAPFLL